MDSFRLSDDVASELVTDAARKFAENRADEAIECVKRRTRVKDYRWGKGREEEGMSLNPSFPFPRSACPATA